MKNFAYLNRYGVVGTIIWNENGFYKISFFYENQNKVEIFISDEIKLRSTDGYEEMSVSELKRFVKSGKLKESEFVNFASVISKLEKVDIYIIIENMKTYSQESFFNFKKVLEDKKII